MIVVIANAVHRRQNCKMTHDEKMEQEGYVDQECIEREREQAIENKVDIYPIRKVL
jgi:hypothetical protein